MGHQVNFYITPTDTKEIESRIRAIQEVDIVHSRSGTSAAQIVPDFQYDLEEHRWLFFYLVRPEDVGAIVMRHVPAQGYWSIDVLRSPVIEFTCCFFDGQILRRGRCYYVDGFYGPDGNWMSKSEAFRKWARKVLSAVKKTLKRHGTDYIGNDAQAWLVSSGGRLVQ